MTDLPTSKDSLIDQRMRRMKRIRTLSAAMANACLVVSALLMLAMAVYWLVTPAASVFGQAGLQLTAPVELAGSVRLVAFAISMVPLAALVFGLFAARRCFAAFADGRVFSRDAISGLRSFAVAVAVSSLLKPLAGALLSLLLSTTDADQAHSIVLYVGSDTLLALLFAAMVAIIAWVLSEATDIADEHQQFV